MATFTITTPTLITALAGKAGGDTYNINGGALMIDCDSRYAPNSTPATGPLGNLTVSSDFGGHWGVTTEFTRLLPFGGGTGTVPAYGTVITQGAASGVLLCAMADRTGGAVYAAGDVMPLTGWLKLRVTAPGFAVGALSGIGAAATAADEQGWIVIVGEETRTHSHARLGTMKMDGENRWFYAGVTSGARGQTIQLPHFTADVGTWYPGVEIETAPGSGAFLFWPNGGSRFTSVNASTDSRSSFVYISTTGLVTIGTGTDALDAGHLSAAGCAVRVPTIILQNCTAANRSVTVEPSRTMGTRYECTYGNAGICDLRGVTGAWYWNILQPYSCFIRDLHTCDNILIGEVSTPPDIDRLHEGLSTSATNYDSNGIVIQQCYNGGTIGTMSWLRALATTTSGYAGIFVNNYGGFTIDKLRGGHIGRAAAVSGSMYFNTNGPVEVNEFWSFTKRTLVQAADNLKIHRLIYADNNVGTTDTTAQTRAIEVIAQCKGVDVTSIENWPGVANCHPYLGLMFANTTQNATLRNCGTDAAPFNAGTANLMAYIFDDGGNNDIIKIQRNWTTGLRLGLHGGTNTTKRLTSTNNYMTDASKTIGPQQQDSIVHGNRFNGGSVPTSYSAVYGNAMWDGFTGDTTTRAALILVEKTTANPDAYQITGGTPKFTGAGRLVMAAAGDRVEWTWPWKILGWNGLTSFAVNGANTASHLFEYDLDKGAGYTGWRTLTNASLLAEVGIDPVAGFWLRMRVTCITANTTNRVDSLRIDGTTTLALQNAALYPLDTCTLDLSGLVAGSSVAVFAGTPVPGQAPLVTLTGSGVSASLVYEYDGDSSVCTLRVRKPGYDPIELQYPNVIEQSIPVAQQANKDGFGLDVYNRGTGTSVGLVSIDPAALRIDIGNGKASGEDTYDVVADWQATVTGLRYPEALRFDGTDLLLVNGWLFRRMNAAAVNAGIDALPVVDGLPSASPDDEVNGSVDFKARSVRTFQVGGASVGMTEATIATAVRAELAAELARLDVAVSTRLATAGYTAAPTAVANATAVRAELGAELARVDVAVSTREADTSAAIRAAGLIAEHDATQAAIAAIPAAPTAASNAAAVRAELATELGRIDVAIGTREAEADAAARAATNQTEHDATQTALGAAGATPAQIASAVRSELGVELGRMDVAVGTRLAAGDYAAAPTPAANAAAVRTELAVELARVDVAVSTREAESAADARAAAGQAEHDATQTVINALSANDAKIDAIKAKTDALTITAGNVHAAALMVADKAGYTLTPAERTLIGSAAEAALLDEMDGQQILDAIVAAIGNQNVNQIALVAAIRVDMERGGGLLALLPDAVRASLAVDFAAIDAAVDTRLAAADYTAPTAGGLTAPQAAQLDALATIHGLTVGAPLTVTPTARTAGTIEQTITEAGTTVTVERTA